MFPDCPAVILVKVRVKPPVGVQRKLLVAFMSNEPSLSVVTVPLCAPVKVWSAAKKAIVEETLVNNVPVSSGNVTVLFEFVLGDSRVIIPDPEALP